VSPLRSLGMGQSGSQAPGREAVPPFGSRVPPPESGRKAVNWARSTPRAPHRAASQRKRTPFKRYLSTSAYCGGGTWPPTEAAASGAVRRSRRRPGGPADYRLGPGARLTRRSMSRQALSSQTSIHSSCRSDCSRPQPRRRNPCTPAAPRSDPWGATAHSCRRIDGWALRTDHRLDTSEPLLPVTTTQAGKSLAVAPAKAGANAPPNRPRYVRGKPEGPPPPDGADERCYGRDQPRRAVRGTSREAQSWLL
jgi:hypothetical protein